MTRKRLSAQQQAIRQGAPTNGHATDGVRVLYETHPGPQTRFMLSDAEEVLYGGAAGGGKSYALRAYGVSYCMSNPGARGVLFRRTYPQLEETHLIEIQKEVPSSVAHFASARHDLIFPNGSILMFRFCEKDDDARRYDTAEFDFMLFDELTHFSQFQYTYLSSRCRSTRPWWPGPRLRAGATPLGIGHDWVKGRWRIDDPQSGATPFDVWRAPVSEGGMTRQFIPARVTDNRTLFDADPGYLERLRALPWEEYQAKALGNWRVLTGQFFMRWRPEIHVIAPFAIPNDWDRFMCVDYGFDAPYAVLWFARPPGGDHIFVYREHYGRGVALSGQIRRARQIVADTQEKVRAIVLDPSMFGAVNVKGDRISPMSADWEAEFGTETRVVPGGKDRVAGWRLMRELIDWQEAPTGGVLVPPKMRVFSSCPNLIRTIPGLIQDPQRPEDLDSDGEDHAADALRYGVMHAYRGGASKGQPTRLFLRPEGIVRRPLDEIDTPTGWDTKRDRGYR